MSDNGQAQPIQPVQPVGPTGAVRPVQGDRAPVQRREHSPEPPAATTGGSLRPAYAQYGIDPDTREVVIRIRDASTDEVLDELPSKEIQAMSKHLRDYAEAMARHRAALQKPADA